MPITRIVIGPNASLDVRGALWFLGSLSALALLVASVCAWFGFWPVLPFAGAEIVAVTAAVWVSLRRNRYREVISVDEDRVLVEIGQAGRAGNASIDSRSEFPRAWVRVSVEAGINRHDPSQLRLGCSGQWVEIGRCLTEDERAALAARLKQVLSDKPARGRMCATEGTGRSAGKPFGE